MIMIISMWDKFVFQKMQCEDWHTWDYAEECISTKEETRRDRKTTKHGSYPLHGGMEPNKRKQHLKHSGRICCMLGNAALSQS